MGQFKDDWPLLATIGLTIVVIFLLICIVKCSPAPVTDEIVIDNRSPWTISVIIRDDMVAKIEGGDIKKVWVYDIRKEDNLQLRTAIIGTLYLFDLGPILKISKVSIHTKEIKCVMKDGTVLVTKF